MEVLLCMLTWTILYHDLLCHEILLLYMDIWLHTHNITPLHDFCFEIPNCTKCSFHYTCLHIKVKKGKVVLLQARCGPEVSRRFRLPDFHDIRHMKVVRSSASRTGCLYPQKCSWYSFSLGAESTPGPWCGRKEICHWKIQWHHRESILGPSD
jgi:hypothetical protein